MHTPIEVNAVAGSKEGRVKANKCAFSHISMSYIGCYITNIINSKSFHLLNEYQDIILIGNIVIY